MASKSELLTLHKYFLTASLMKQQLDRLLQAPDADRSAENPDVWSYLSLWYGCLRVVLEGWHDLKLHDPDVDPLLNSANITQLNGFRNDTFHFKPDYYSKRTQALLNNQDFAKWIRNLHGPLGSSILKQLREARI